MSIVWLALAAALLLVPVPGQGAVRARALAGDAAALREHRAEYRTDPAELLARTGVRVVGGLILALAAVAVLLRCGPALAAACAVGAFAGGRLVHAGLTRRREVRQRAGLIAAVRLLVAELESGARPAAALAAAAESTGPHAPALASALASALTSALASAARAAARGEAVGAALTREPDLAALGHAWRVADGTGAALAGVLSGVAADLADRAETERAVSAAVAGARASAGLLTMLPLLGLLLGTAMGAHPWSVLTGSPGGRLACCAGVVLDAAGVLWTQRLVRRAERP